LFGTITGTIKGNNNNTLSESNPAWLNTLKQTTPEAIWTCNTSAHVLGTAHVKCKNKQRKRFQLLHPDTPIAANISQWQTLHNTNVNQYKSPQIPIIQNWKSSTYTDGSAMRNAISNQQIIGTGIFTPTTDAGYSDTVTINPGGSGPTLTINRAELAAVLVAVQKGHTEIATDSASLFQIRKQLLNPMAVLHHLHRELLKDIVNLIQSSPSPVTFYKVKSHSGNIGNEGADHLAHKAAVNQFSDVSLPPATDPFYDLFWLSVPNKVGSHAEELRVLTNLQGKLKHHMHAHHYLGEANTYTLLYKLWQQLHDTPQRAAHAARLSHTASYCKAPCACPIQ